MRISSDIPESLKNALIVVGKAFSIENERIYLVGGAARDLLLNKEPSDLDFTTSATPAAIRRIMRRDAKNIFDKSKAKGYGTQGMELKTGGEVEITPFRRAAAPESEKADAAEINGSVTLEQDLESRDFTMNALAVDVSPGNFGEITDPFNGGKDLLDGILRTPAPPANTLEDDPLRAVRAARFAAQFHLTPVSDLISAILNMAREKISLDRVSLERVRLEFEKMLMLEKPSSGFKIMYDWGLLGCYLPEVALLAELEPEPGGSHKDIFQHTLAVLDAASALGPPDPPFRFAALLHDSGKPETRRLTENGYVFHEHEKAGARIAEQVCRRLKWSNDDTARIAELVRKHHRLSAYSSEWTDSAVRRALHDLGARYPDILALSRADITTSFPEKKKAHLDRLEDFLARVEKLEIEQILNPTPPIDGVEIMRLLGARPGPLVGRAVNLLKDMIVSGELDPSDTDSARRIVINNFNKTSAT